MGLEGQVVAIFCRRMLANRPTTIYGDGSQTRDFVYVDDVVKRFMAARTIGQWGARQHRKQRRAVGQRPSLTARRAHRSKLRSGLRGRTAGRASADLRRQLKGGRGTRLEAHRWARRGPQADGGLVPLEPQVSGKFFSNSTNRTDRAPTTSRFYVE